MYQHHSIRQQKGIAAILFILVVGVSLLGIVMGAMHYSRSNQDSAIANHALSQAQMRAWNGAEGFRQYLYQIGSSGAAALAIGNNITFTGTGISGVSGQVVSVSSTATTCTGGIQVTANLIGVSANATATVQSVYCVAGNAAPPTTSLNAININGNLDLSGSIDVTGTSNATFIVNGNISAHGASIGTFNSLYAKGNITISSGTYTVNTITSEGDITLSNSGSTFNSVNAMGDINISDGVSIINAMANGSVTDTGKSATTIKAIKDVSLANTKVTNIYSDGNISIGGSDVQTLRGVGSFTDANWGTVVDGQVGGSITQNQSFVKEHVIHVDNLAVDITPLTSQTLSLSTIDAWQLRSSANLIFDVDNSNRKTVTVSNMNGIANGTYYLTGDGNGGHNDYLCTTTSYSSNACVKKICQGQSDSNSCFNSYSGNDWTINGKSNNEATLVPGVVWIHGDITVGQGNYFNTIIASGNITTASSTLIESPNYAGYNNICASSYFGAFNATNLCQNGTYISSALENIALLAGGYQSGVFSGGNISLGAQNKVYGDILAGNLLTTGGNTTVYGYIAVGAEADSSGTTTLTAHTTLDLSNLPPTYDPGTVPNTGNGGSGGVSVSLVWSRYL